jgi:hypothetical protein
VEIGYDGFARNSFQKSAISDLWVRFRVEITTVQEYSDFVRKIGAYMASLGVTYRSNEFVDADLTLGEDHFENIRGLITSARKQGHDGIQIRLTPESFTRLSFGCVF